MAEWGKYRTCADALAFTIIAIVVAGLSISHHRRDAREGVRMSGVGIAVNNVVVMAETEMTK